MISSTWLINQDSIQRFARDLCAQHNGFLKRAVAEPAAANVINLASSRVLKKMVERHHKILAVNIIPHLLAAMTEDPVLTPQHSTFHQIR